MFRVTSTIPPSAVFPTAACTHLCGTLPHLNHLEQGHVLHPVLLIMAIHPAKTRGPPCCPTFGLVSGGLLPFLGCLQARKMSNRKRKCVIVLHALHARAHGPACRVTSNNESAAAWD